MTKRTVIKVTFPGNMQGHATARIGDLVKAATALGAKVEIEEVEVNTLDDGNLRRGGIVVNPPAVGERYLS